MKQYGSFKEYMKDQTGKGKEMLLLLRDIIYEVVPDVEEAMGYGVPAYGLIKDATLNEKIMIANFKGHVGLYPHADTIVAFKEHQKDYKCLVGTIQFKHSQEIPVELVKAIILHRYNVIKNR